MTMRNASGKFASAGNRGRSGESAVQKAPDLAIWNQTRGRRHLLGEEPSPAGGRSDRGRGGGGGSVMLTVHSRRALCIAVQRGAKSSGAFEEPFLRLKGGTRLMLRG